MQASYADVHAFKCVTMFGLYVAQAIPGFPYANATHVLCSTETQSWVQTLGVVFMPPFRY